MKTYKTLALSSLVVMALFLSACGQKEDQKKTRIRAGMAGTAADTATRQVQDQLFEQGIAMSISDITKRQDSSQGAVYVETSYLIGEKSGGVTTVHAINQSSQNVQTGSSAGMGIKATGYCADTKCDWYYLNIDVSQNGSFIYQVGILRDFTNGQDLYKVISAEGRISSQEMFQFLYNNY